VSAPLVFRRRRSGWAEGWRAIRWPCRSTDTAFALSSGSLVCATCLSAASGGALPAVLGKPAYGRWESTAMDLLLALPAGY
jgi:hypothetical protein